jgi:poly-gamma-glutamate capsule biosynthesis protein CapA/YwtB (metallophosphatase superfamily)
MKKIVQISIFFCFYISSSLAQVSFCAVGDVLFDRGVRTTIESNSVNYLFDKVRDIISQNELAFFNLECPLANIEDGYPLMKKYSFRADTSNMNGLKYAGFNIASVANNHTIDYGKGAFMKTINLLISNKILPIGGGKNQAEASKPLLIEKNGETFAFFGMVDFILDATIFDPNSPYPAFIKIDTLCNKVRELNSLVDHIIISIHWGKGNTTTTTQRQIDYAHRLIDAGADLILGHHPHVLQGIETYHNKLIIYSLGNFVFDHPQELNRQSIIFKCKFQNGNIIEPNLIPIEIINNRPTIADSSSSLKIYNQIEKVSAGFNTAYSLNNKFISINNLKERPLKEFFYEDLKFDIYKNCIKVYNNLEFDLQYSLPDSNFLIQDICMFPDSNAIYFYSIVSNKLNNKSQIAVFPFSQLQKKFLQASLDGHDYFSPWKIDLFDVDNDGNPEIILGVYKSTRYDEKKENRLFVFNREKDYMYPKWLGSKLAYPFIDFKIDKSLGGLILLEDLDDNKAYKIALYKWNGFGFDRNKVIGEITDSKHIKKLFQLSGLDFDQFQRKL